MKTVIFIILIFSTSAFAQDGEKRPQLKKINWRGKGLNLKMNSIRQKAIIPSAFMVAGISLNSLNTKTKIQEFVRKPFNGYKTSLDDYIQYAPIAIMYGADIFKVPARNSIWNQTKYLFISEVITGSIVQILKHTTKITRPDGSAPNSFPSGHTGQAFVTSQVLFNEYYRTRPLLGLSGYVFSGATGLLRVVNNRHWVPDVLLGAGIAIIVTNLVYYFEPLKNWDPFKKLDNDISIFAIPAIQADTYGLKMSLTF